MNQIPYFNPPNSNIKLPLMKQGKKLKFSIFEIGCKPHHKRGQILGQEVEFRNEWTKYYKKQKGVKWEPNINRYVVHFMSEYNAYTYNLFAKTNGYITCTGFPFFLFSNTSEIEDEHLLKKIKSSKDRELLEGIINSGASEELFNLITTSKGLSDIRGYSAELLIQKSLAFAARKTGVKYVPNYLIRNSRAEGVNAGKHLEIDMLFVYYEDTAFKKFMNRIINQPHMKFNYDRHKIYRPEEFMKPRV